MKATFEHSVDVLVKAYMNDTLKHGHCMACAVGNLVRDANPGIKYQEQMKWNSVFATTYCGPNGEINRLIRPENLPNAINQIESTGYTWEQLSNIEYAFESASRKGDWMFNGLLAVVDVLAEIHKVDLSVKESAVKTFQEIQQKK